MKMITYLDRKQLQFQLEDLQNTDKNFVGVDCYGRFIKIGDSIEVVNEEENRKNLVIYDFCSVGKTGIVIPGPSYSTSWFVHVKFADREVSCVDYHLKKL